jgi:two-component system response regulator AtoC
MEHALARILTIEDEESLRFSIARALTKAGHMVEEASTLLSGWEKTRVAEFDAILTDVNLEPAALPAAAGIADGIDLVRRLRDEGYAGGLVVMTGYGSVQSAVRAMKLGADDYLQKPVSLDELTLLVERLLEEKRVRGRLRLYERLERVEARAHGMVGRSPAWMATLSLAERLAGIPITRRDPRAATGTGGALPTILILGETGTGKGVLARHIHQAAQEAALRAGGKGESASTASATPSHPFVHINCSALPPTLVESELFGHEKGAFTDAKTAREGLFEMADGGTVFLDEIGDMPLDLQAKLLTVVEDGVFRRVGSAKDRAVRARIIAATNQDLEKRSSEGGAGAGGTGAFRRDLYYRLNAFTIRIPPLRERAQDALVLAEEMLSRFAREYGRPTLTLTDDASRAILSHSWPGNVRELVNVMQRVAMLCDKPQVAAADLALPGAAGGAFADPAPQASAPRSQSEHAMVVSGSANGLVFDFEHGVCNAEEVERQLIVQALQKTGGNVSKAAKLIGMQRSSFRYRLERFGLEGYVQEIARP